MLLETPLQGVLIFFAPRALRLLGALGYAPINSPRTLQHPDFYRDKPPHFPLVYRREPTLETKGL